MGNGMVFDNFDPDAVPHTTDRDGYWHYWATDGDMIQEWARSPEGIMRLVAEVSVTTPKDAS